MGINPVEAERHTLRAQSPDALTGLKSTRLSRPLHECIGIVLLCPILLSVALWNGFPVIFYDTGAYLFEGLGGGFLAERSPVYSLFLYFAGAQISLWLVAIAQAVLTSFVIVEFARAERPHLSLLELLLGAVVLVIVSGLPWYVGQITPDFMTSLVVICMYLLAFRGARLGSVRGGLLVLAAGFAVAAHPSHLGLAAGLVLAIMLLRLVRFRLANGRLPRVDIARPAFGLALGLSLVLASNAVLAKDLFVSRSGPVFVFARLLQDGIVTRLLDDTCPGSHYALCSYKNKLPNRADAFLWDRNTPFDKLGRFKGQTAEYERIILDSLQHYPWMNFEAALRDTAIQFFTFKTGDQIEPQEWVLYPDLDRFIPSQMHAYMSARQQRGEIRFAALNRLHMAVALLALLGLFLAFGRFFARRRWRQIALPAFVLLALLGNAFICGALSNPHDRYQSRLIWVPALALLLMRRPQFQLALQRSVESGT